MRANINETFETKVSVKIVPALPDTFQVVINGRDYYFTEEKYLETFEQVAKLWSILHESKTKP